MAGFKISHSILEVPSTISFQFGTVHFGAISKHVVTTDEATGLVISAKFIFG